jgi:rubrerythrin
MKEYSIPNTPRTSPLVTWLRCRACHAGYFAAGAPGPQACPACAGGRQQLVGLWDLRTEAAPAGMLRRGEG